MMARLGLLIQSLLTISIFYLGFSIYTFTNVVSNVVETYPQAIKDISEITATLEVEQWLLVAKTFENIAPQALNLTHELKTTLVDVNQTIISVDQKIPQVLSEVKAIREHTIPDVIRVVDTVNHQTVPDALTELKHYRTSVIPAGLVESNGYRTTALPALIKESELLRQDVPIILAKADEIVQKSEELTKNATQGAVKGVILSPINLLRDAGTELKSKVKD